MFYGNHLALRSLPNVRASRFLLFLWLKEGSVDRFSPHVIAGKPTKPTFFRSVC